MHETRPFIEWRANLENWPLLSQMDIDSSAKGEKTDAASTREAGKEQVEEAGASGVCSPPFKRQKTRTSEEEFIGEEQLLE